MLQALTCKQWQNTSTAAHQERKIIRKTTIILGQLYKVKKALAKNYCCLHR